MSASTIVLLAITIQLMMPLAWAAFGEIISERSGVLNVGLEGAVLIGAWGAAVGSSNSGSLLVGLISGLASGFVLGLVLAVLYVWRGVDQVVGGVMINLFAIGFTSAMWAKFEGDAAGKNFPRVSVPGLSELPVVGKVLFQQNVLVYAVVVFALALALVLRRTQIGLLLRATGESPDAVDGAGWDVRRIRTVGVTVGTTLGALGGAALVLTASSGRFVTNMSGGIGFIALGVVLLARWKPVVALIVAAAFGFLQALQSRAQSITWLNDVPSEFLLMLPYLGAIVVVAISRGSRYPAALGVAWSRGS
jgi:ABC-type uncharacterized transport system permease subunit